MQSSAAHGPSRGKFVAFRFEHDLERWLAGVREARTSDPEPTLSDV